MNRQRLIVGLLVLIITPLGFYTKFYEGAGSRWVNDSLGGLLYVVFWCLVVFIAFPKSRSSRIAVAVFLATCLLEFLQLWRPPFLEFLRSFFIGRTILGNSFNWMDFPYYFIGSVIGYFIIRVVRWGIR
ncbi:MAG: DUF2809 domain-containing protein [Bacteroidales bacterium]